MLNGFDITTNQWKTPEDGRYTMAASYDWIRDKGTSVAWYNLVWHKSRFSKCVFVTWLALHPRLMSRDISNVIPSAYFSRQIRKVMNTCCLYVGLRWFFSIIKCNCKL